MKGTNTFISELKRRNVFRVAMAYAISGWLIIQVCTSTFPYLGVPDWMITAVIVFVLIGFPLSIIVAWAFELTPEGIKKSKEVDITESVTQRTGKKLNRLIITCLSIALVFVLGERLFFAESTILAQQEDTLQSRTASIAVLPFEDFSPQGDQEYFADGLSEELLNVLAKIEELKVAGRTSSFKFKGMNENLSMIGEELNVDHILEGSVRKSGNRIRVTAQLIKVDDGYHIWSENFDRELTLENLFDIQDEISQKVMEELKIRLLPQEKALITERPTQDIEAYNAFLEATQLEVTKSVDDLNAAIAKYQEAVRIDPNFALAYARLAMAYGSLYSNGNLPIEDMSRFMRENIDRALLLNGNEGKAYEAMGYLYLNTRDDRKALETFERAIELLPNDAEVYDGYHLALEANDRFFEGVEVMRKSYELDRLNPDIASHHANHLLYLRETDEANRILNTILDKYPDYNYAQRIKSRSFSNVGELDAAFLYLHGAVQENPDDLNLLVSIYYAARSLRMFEVASYYRNHISELYPNNIQYMYMQLQSLMDNKNYETAIRFIEEAKSRFASEFSEGANESLAEIYSEQGDILRAIDLLENTYPWLKKGDISLTDENSYPAMLYILYHKMLDSHDASDRVSYLFEQYQTYYDVEMQNAVHEAEKIGMIWIRIDIHILMDEYDEAVELIRKLYFEYLFKNGFSTTFDNYQLYMLMDGYPPYEELKKDIMTDIQGMRNNTVSSLKEEGKWPDDWKSTL